MARDDLVDLLGLYHTDREIPSDVFVMRRFTDHSERASKIGEVIAGKFLIKQGEGVPGHRPGYRVEAIEPRQLQELAAGLGITATSPEGIVEEITGLDSITVHEFGLVAGEPTFNDGESFFGSV